MTNKYRLNTHSLHKGQIDSRVKTVYITEPIAYYVFTLRDFLSA